MSPTRVLLLEDVETDAKLAVRQLQRAGIECEARVVATEKSFLAALEDFRPQLILADFTLPHYDGMKALALAREVCPDVPFLFVSGTIGEERAVDALQRGAYDYVLKSNLRRLAPAVERALKLSAELAARRRSEEALKESEYRLDLALQASDLATWEWNVATGEVRFSRHWWRILGYGPDEVPSRVESWEALAHPDDLVLVKSALADHFKGSTPTLGIEYRMRAKNGDWRWIHTIGRVTERDAAGRALRSTGTHGDVTERKQVEESIRRLNRVYAVISGINSLIVRVRDRDELLREACRIAVEAGRFVVAWAGYYDAASNEIIPLVGLDAEIIRSGYRIELAAAEGQGLPARAVREKQVVWENDLLAAQPIVGIIRQGALRRGARAAAACPLIVDDAVVAVMIFYAECENFFNDEELRVLRELAGDLSFALDHIAKTEHIAYVTTHDTVTGMPNRRLFADRLSQALTARNTSLGVVLVDVERFKSINEAFGRHAGDELLRQLAQRLQHAFQDAYTLAHIGGDWFAVMRGEVADAAELARDVRDRMERALQAPFVADRQELRLTARAGIALYPADGTDPEKLLQNAESALKQAKTLHEPMVFYTPDLNARVGERLALESRLRRAVQEEQFVLHYQPKVDFTSGSIVGVEALIRWRDPQTGLVPPGEFVPLLEESGLILQAGRWAMKEAVRMSAALRAKGWPNLRVAVNVSHIQLRQSDFVGSVEEAIAAAGGAQHGLDLEITESVLMDDIDANVRKLRELAEMEIELAIDDFGTGYSSLAYLARLPVNVIKIDRSFVREFLHDADSTSIVSSIISLAHALKRKVVAEGVETSDQAQLLRLLRCDQYQGYLYSKPLPAGELEALLAGAASAGAHWSGHPRRS